MRVTECALLCAGSLMAFSSHICFRPNHNWFVCLHRAGTMVKVASSYVLLEDLLYYNVKTRMSVVHRVSPHCVSLKSFRVSYALTYQSPKGYQYCTVFDIPIGVTSTSFFLQWYIVLIVVTYNLLALYCCCTNQLHFAAWLRFRGLVYHSFGSYGKCN